MAGCFGSARDEADERSTESAQHGRIDFVVGLGCKNDLRVQP